MPRDPFDLSQVPPDVVTEARRVLDQALLDLSACPLAGSAFGWWIQGHTQACLAGLPDGGTPEAWMALYDVHLRDGASIVMGDPRIGAFVSMTPQAPRPELGASWEEPFLGQVRKKYRISFSRGSKIAEKVYADLRPLSERLILVGSLRRKRPEVADVEFVVLPKDEKDFARAVQEMGFETGAKRRKYTGVLDGVKIELYMAKEPDELGALVLAYTGDYLMNVAMRSKAKRMGYKLDQYGIWKGKKAVLRSPDEKDFFRFLGMDWHEPEQRSLAARSELEKVIRDLLSITMDLSKDEAYRVLYDSDRLKKDKALDSEEEVHLRELHRKQFGDARASMGAEELLELGYTAWEDPEEEG